MSEKRRPTSSRPGSRATTAKRSAPMAARKSVRPTQAKRPVKKKKKGSAFDFETIVAMILIVCIIVGAIMLIYTGISRCDCGSEPKQKEYTANANIVPEETPVPAETGSTDNTITDNNQYVQITAVPVINNNTYVNNGQLRSATIRTVGDFVIHDVVFKSAKRIGKANGTYEYDFGPMLSYVKNYMSNADFTVANVDGCLGGEKSYRYGYSGYPQFNTPPHLLYALVDSGVDMLTLANNHMLDGWYTGLMNTIENVESVGLKHVGANRSEQEKVTPVIYEINGIKVGFMNYTVSLNSMDTQKALDPKAMEFAVNATKNSNATADAARLRSAGADVIVCFMHWGEEYTSAPNNDQEYYANMLVKAGVDVIMGGHPHQVQPAKWLTGTNQFGEEQKTLCVYSIGNFLSDQRAEATSGGVMFDFTIQERSDGSFEIVSPGYLPTWVWRTGSGESDYNYYVLPTQDYLTTRPAAMNNNDYQLMLNNYNSTLSVMQKGVGNLLTK